MVYILLIIQYPVKYYLSFTLTLKTNLANVWKQFGTAVESSVDIYSCHGNSIEIIWDFLLFVWVCEIRIYD